VRDDDIPASSDGAACSQLNPCRVGRTCFRHVIAVPLEYKGEPVGVFNLFFDRAEASPSQIKPLLKPIGQLLGLTLENAALERESARTALLAERQTMAADIHDSLAQTLAFARMRLPLLEDAVRAGDGDRALRYCSDLAGELGCAHKGLRGLITHFRAGMDARGLKRGLRDVVMRFRESSGVELDFDNQVPDLALPVEAEVQVFFIVQEALANVRKHAKATRARLAVDKVDDGVEILIEDNGCGQISDPAVLRISEIAAASYGLRIMRERAQRFGGRVSFENLPKGGARVRLFVPDRGAEA
jgi:two-component system nitrate/nitrite sensor histidine kinase NarX